MYVFRTLRPVHYGAISDIAIKYECFIFKNETHPINHSNHKHIIFNQNIKTKKKLFKKFYAPSNKPS